MLVEAPQPEAIRRNPRAPWLAVAVVHSALPAGFGASALGGEALLPGWMTNRQRGLAGALTCAFALVMLNAMPLSPSWIMPALAGVGLGIGPDPAGRPDATAAVAVPAAAAALAAAIRPPGIGRQPAETGSARAPG